MSEFRDAIETEEENLKDLREQAKRVRIAIAVLQEHSGHGFRQTAEALNETYKALNDRMAPPRIRGIIATNSLLFHEGDDSEVTNRQISAVDHGATLLCSAELTYAPRQTRAWVTTCTWAALADTIRDPQANIPRVLAALCQSMPDVDLGRISAGEVKAALLQAGRFEQSAPDPRFWAQHRIKPRRAYQRGPVALVVGSMLPESDRPTVHRLFTSTLLNTVAQLSEAQLDQLEAGQGGYDQLLLPSLALRVALDGGQHVVISLSPFNSSLDFLVQSFVWNNPVLGQFVPGITSDQEQNWNMATADGLGGDNNTGTALLAVRERKAYETSVPEVIFMLLAGQLYWQEGCQLADYLDHAESVAYTNCLLVRSRHTEIMLSSFYNRAEHKVVSVMTVAVQPPYGTQLLRDGPMPELVPPGVPGGEFTFDFRDQWRYRRPQAPPSRARAPAARVQHDNPGQTEYFHHIDLNDTFENQQAPKQYYVRLVVGALDDEDAQAVFHEYRGDAGALEIGRHGSDRIQDKMRRAAYLVSNTPSPHAWINPVPREGDERPDTRSFYMNLQNCHERLSAWQAFWKQEIVDNMTSWLNDDLSKLVTADYWRLPARCDADDYLGEELAGPYRQLLERQRRPHAIKDTSELRVKFDFEVMLDGRAETVTTELIMHDMSDDHERYYEVKDWLQSSARRQYNAYDELTGPLTRLFTEVCNDADRVSDTVDYRLEFPHQKEDGLTVYWFAAFEMPETLRPMTDEETVENLRRLYEAIVARDTERETRRWSDMTDAYVAGRYFEFIDSIDAFGYAESRYARLQSSTTFDLRSRQIMLPPGQRRAPTGADGRQLAAMRARLEAAEARANSAHLLDRVLRLMDRGRPRAF